MIDLAADGTLPQTKVKAKLRDIERQRRHLNQRLDTASADLTDAARLIDAGWIDAAVVGGVDSLCLTTLYGFQSLADDAGKKSWINNPRTNLANVSLKCIGDNCTSLIYRTIVNASTVNKEPDWVKHTIQYIKANSDIDSVSKIGYIQTSADLKS